MGELFKTEEVGVVVVMVLTWFAEEEVVVGGYKVVMAV